MTCPLCNGNHLQQLACIEANHLQRLWVQHGIDIDHLVRTDLHLMKCQTCGLQFYFPLTPGDDLFYGALSEWSWYYKHPGKSEYSYASNLISRGDNVIDIGCGIGEFSKYLPSGCSFTGIELSSRSVKIANSLNRNVLLLSVEDAVQEFDQFSYVVCFQVLEHLSSLDSFITSCIKLCKKDGYLIFACPNNDGFLSCATNNFLNMPPHHTLLWNQQSLSYLAAKYQLKIIDYINEPLQDVHKHWAYTIYINAFFRKLCMLNVPIISFTLFSRLIYKFSSIIARLMTRLFPSMVKDGHSSIIVLQKV